MTSPLTFGSSSGAHGAAPPSSLFTPFTPYTTPPPPILVFAQSPPVRPDVEMSESDPDLDVLIAAMAGMSLHCGGDMVLATQLLQYIIVMHPDEGAGWHQDHCGPGGFGGGSGGSSGGGSGGGRCFAVPMTA
jgi:uncharacterized membrane protein YgcG